MKQDDNGIVISLQLILEENHIETKDFLGEVTQQEQT